ncbi:SelD-related putative sulfur metabolism protein [Vulcanisaeta thermophila]|uniref:SelD-related putative sulfur metabolism protein n=1 Tax=Vulcanisaeta thermophila TaxID=867917 RepID=UPI0008533E56|nr:SelD-related putative sulfur metabolism protein [Vulcanisaeta thermophila]
MSDRITAFRERLNRYMSLGVNLLSLAIGCSVKVDLYDVLYPALSLMKDELSRLNLEIQHREDVAVLSKVGDYELIRRIYGIPSVKVDPGDVDRISPDVALVLLQVHQSRASSPDEFAKVVLELYRQLGSSRARVRIGKGHSIVSTRQGAEFALLDYIRASPGDRYLLANNDTIQIIDPTEDPGNYRQVATAVSNALNDLFIKGVYRDIDIYPVYDAPTDELREQLLRNYTDFGRRWGFNIIIKEQPSVNYLLMGSTVIGYLDKEPPMFYDEVRQGFKVLVTRPFGELAIISTYLTAHVDEELMRDFESNVMSIGDLEKLKVKIMDILSKPNVEVARVINKYLPEVGGKFRPEEHIAVTIDISGPGIFVFKEIAEQSNVDIRLWDVPLIEPRVNEYAASRYIITDSTAGTNGAIAIVASDDVINSIIRDLRGIEGVEPMVIGEVIGKGSGRLIVPDWISKYIVNKSLLSKLVTNVDLLKDLRRIKPTCGKLVRLEARIYGKVQGVGFRPMIRRQALSLRLTGYARNLPDRTVEVVAEGGESEVMALLEWIRSSPVGVVERVDYRLSEYRGEFNDFNIH